MTLKWALGYLQNSRMMRTFSDTVLELMHSKLNRQDFLITMQNDHHLELTSKKVQLFFSYDEREDFAAMYAGLRGEEMFLITWDIVQTFIDPEIIDSLVIPEKTIDDFVENLEALFKSKGQKLLKGDKKLFKRISDLHESMAHKYTSNIVDSQNIERANKAWKDNEYYEVIRLLEKVSSTRMTESLKKKYEISLSRLKEY